MGEGDSHFGEGKEEGPHTCVTLTLSYPASENSSQHRGGAIIAPPLILMLGDSDPVETLDT